LFNDFRQVEATEGSDYNQWLVDEGKCVEHQEDPCIGDQKDYILFFFGGEYTADNTTRNVIILAVVLILVRYFTWIALKYIRFSK
jgi:hypothetical protein